MGIVSMSQEWVNQYGTLNEKLFLGMTMALVGMVIVFIMLIVIVIAIVFMSKILRSLQKSVLKEASLPSEAPFLPGNATPADAAISAVAGNIDHSLVAVITAAVAMMMTEQSGDPLLYPGFRVKSIRRIR